ncbi:adipogenesis regulatory factor-like [Hemicordylus capensis]|uniref:adipogenesis regulatory factor-like n=1 Tax=Hemicordylus capensis TaxID=884348 RepID=UPI00230329D8|nr:adipogenesis regulatory factor-like [Hemicordylus capensis]
MFKLNLAEEAKKLTGTTAQDTVNSANQAVQQVVDQVTETGQKVLDDVCKTTQDAGEKAVQNVTSQVSAWGKSFGQSEEKKNAST